MVTTHLRARAAQAGALLAVVLGGVFVAPAVALADPPDVEAQVQDNVLSGGRVTMTVQVTNTNDIGGAAVDAAIRVNGGGMDCGNTCQQRNQITNSGQFSVQLTAPQIAAGETRQFTVTVSATIEGEPRPGTAAATITVKGPDKPQAVRQVSGRIKDQDGKAVSGATVGMQDSTGRTFQTTSDGSGSYSFRSTESKPIAPGKISIGAGKNGFSEATVQRQAEAGRNLTVSLTLKSKVTPSPSVSTSPSASVSATPTEEVSEEQTTPEETTATEPPTDNTAANEDDDGGSMLYIIIGVLLVAAGIGAIVLVVLRRRNSGGDDGPTGRPGSGGPVPPGPGRFTDATRVGTPVGGGRSDATMIAPRSGAPSMSDAPTMLQRPVPAVEDEFPDPYGAPMPQPGTYAGTPAGAWNDPGNQYGGGTQQYGGGTQQYGGGTQQYGGQAQSDDDGYGAVGGAQQGAGYGAYGEATGMYRPEAEPEEAYGVPYEQGAGQYGTQQYGGGQYGADQGAQQYGGGYGQQPADQGGYGSWTAPGDAIDNNGYGPQDGQYGGGAYGGGQAGGVPAGGVSGGQQYGGQPYDDGYQGEQRGGYDSPPAGGYADQAGYEDPQYGQNGYNQRGGTHGGGQPRPETPGPRRGSHDY